MLEIKFLDPISFHCQSNPFSQGLLYDPSLELKPTDPQLLMSFNEVTSIMWMAFIYKQGSYQTSQGYHENQMGPYFP